MQKIVRLLLIRLFFCYFFSVILHLSSLPFPLFRFYRRTFRFSTDWDIFNNIAVCELWICWKLRMNKLRWNLCYGFCNFPVKIHSNLDIILLPMGGCLKPVSVPVDYLIRQLEQILDYIGCDCTSQFVTICMFSWIKQSLWVAHSVFFFFFERRRNGWMNRRVAEKVLSKSLSNICIMYENVV